MAVKYECDKCHNLFDTKLTPVDLGHLHYQVCNACLHEFSQLMLNPKFSLHARVELVREEDGSVAFEGEIFRRIRFPQSGDHFYHYDVMLDDGELITDIPENVLRIKN